MDFPLKLRLFSYTHGFSHKLKNFSPKLKVFSPKLKDFFRKLKDPGNPFVGILQKSVKNQAWITALRGRWSEGPEGCCNRVFYSSSQCHVRHQIHWTFFIDTGQNTF